MHQGGRIIFSQKDGLVLELQELNKFLRKRDKARGNWKERRRRVLQKGVFFPLRYLKNDEIRAFFENLPLVGVDGSLNVFGASFPYLVIFFRALAKSTKPGGENGCVWARKLFSPLLPAHWVRVEEKLKMGLDPEEILARIRWETLAQLEVEVGKEALEKYRPRLILWDGGFARMKAHTPEVWTNLKAQAIKQGVVMLGITEEIATSTLGSWMDFAGETGSFADREALYGLLNPGEAFQWEKGRVCVRLARHPQVVAVDYLPEQAEDLEFMLNFLYTITPRQGRGFPLWLDVVDVEVRLTGEQIEGFLAAYLDPALTELFLRPLRFRRDF